MNLVEGNNILNVSMTTTARVGTLDGVVSDELGPLQGVLVTVSGIGTDTTDAAGYYQFADIPVGAYTVTFSKSGYITVTR